MRSAAALLAALMVTSPTMAAEEAAVVAVRDLRAERWRTTAVINVGSAAIQHTGDDTRLGSFRTLVAKRIGALPNITPISVVSLKTADVRLSLPDVRVDQNAVEVTGQLVPNGALLAAPIAALISMFSKNKTASAVFCVSIDGKDYLGNDARLFRIGAEAELMDAVEVALQRLSKAVASGTATDSVACEPGWEGGQPRRD
jgi:hypothetical protein